MNRNHRSISPEYAANLRKELVLFDVAEDGLSKAIHAHLAILIKNRETQLSRDVEGIEKKLAEETTLFQQVKETVARSEIIKERVNKIPDAAEFGLKVFASERLVAVDKLLIKLDGGGEKQKTIDVLMVINADLDRINALEQAGPVFKQFIDKIGLLESNAGMTIPLSLAGPINLDFHSAKCTLIF